MSDIAAQLGAGDPEGRSDMIVGTLTDAFACLMATNPAAFRAKFRKMAADPFSFYRGSACLFYADMARLEDPWADERTARVWIQGDLHAENFGTYMDGSGALVFDVNDFDEAYFGHFSWDVNRLAASVALLGWRKALPDTDVDALVARYARAYLDQIRRFLDSEHETYSLGREDRRWDRSTDRHRMRSTKRNSCLATFLRQSHACRAQTYAEVTQDTPGATGRDSLTGVDQDVGQHCPAERATSSQPDKAPMRPSNNTAWTIVIRKCAMSTTRSAPAQRSTLTVGEALRPVCGVS